MPTNSNVIVASIMNIQKEMSIRQRSLREAAILQYMLMGFFSCSCSYNVNSLSYHCSNKKKSSAIKKIHLKLP